MYLGQADPSAPWCTQCYESTTLTPGESGYVDTEDPCDMASTAYAPSICQSSTPMNPTAGGTYPPGAGAGVGTTISSILNSVLNTIVPPIQRATGTGPYTPPPVSTGFFGTAAGASSSLLIVALVLGGAYFLSKGGK